MITETNTLKNEISALLASDRLSEYLVGIKLLTAKAGTADLPDSDLDQGIIERACGVLIFEKWAEHKDYIGLIEELMASLPDYFPLIENEKIGHHFRGLSLFAAGLNERKHDLKGFTMPTHSGFMLSNIAAKSIKEYMIEQGEDQDKIDHWEDMENFFGMISNAQFGIVPILSKIKKWSVPMADGFYNILKSAGFNDQSRMLSGLYFALEDPVVKKEIFERYLNTLNKVKDSFTAKEDQATADEVNNIIKMVESKRKGE